MQWGISRTILLSFGIDRRAGRVFVRIDDGVTRDGCFMSIRAFAAAVAVFDVLLGILW
jgi:hypothetical protein